MLSTIFFFLITVGLLITFHELGHFLAARTLGVKVERFSVGFGPILWRYRPSPEETEYVISALPLGGYVKMVDEREGEVPAHLRPYAFNRQPLWKRAVIVAAGPLFNFLLALLLFWLVGMVGERGLRPVVGEVPPGTLAAEAGLRAGDEIFAVDGARTPVWPVALERLTAALISRGEVELTLRSPEGELRTVRLSVPPELLRDPETLRKRLGLRPYLPPVQPVLARVLPGSPAERAGLKAGDRIVAIEGRPVRDWQEVVEAVQSSPGRPLRLLVERRGEQFEVEVVPEAVGKVGRIGVQVALSESYERELSALQTTYRLDPLSAFARATGQVLEYSWITLEAVGKLIVGKASLSQLGGPVSIAVYAGKTAAVGVVPFLKFIALLSISLGVLNLLPIPVLDGGHLALFAVEGIRGRPLPEETIAWLQQLGMAFLLLLMLLVLYMDIQRLTK